jgi:hypothetical protein
MKVKMEFKYYRLVVTGRELEAEADCCSSGWSLKCSASTAQASTGLL